MKTLKLEALIDRAGILLDMYHENFEPILGIRFDNIIRIIESYA